VKAIVNVAELPTILLLEVTAADAIVAAVAVIIVTLLELSESITTELLEVTEI
jgi:hypothetical protein